MSGFLTTDGADYYMSIFGKKEEPVDRYFLALVGSQRPGLTADGYDLDEPADDSYSRAEIDNVDGNWVVMHGQLSNSSEIAFPIAASQWGYVHYWAICDLEEGGRVLWVGEFTDAFYVGPDVQATVPAGGLVMSFALFGWGA